MHNRTLRRLAVLAALALCAGTAGADTPGQLAARVEEELLSEGYSLARLGQTLAVIPDGTALRVEIIDRSSGKPIASRTVERLPADPAAAVAQLTVVAGELLRERGVQPARKAGDGWTVTFAPAAVIAYHRPPSIAVVAAGVSDRNRSEARASANAVLGAYRAAGIAKAEDAHQLGELGEAEDPAIVARAAALGVDEVAVVRVFLDGPTARAVVTIYSKTGQLVGGFSAAAGQPLAAPATISTGVEGGVADHVLRDKPAEAALDDKDGVVRLWVHSKDPQVQLLTTETAQITAGTHTGQVAINNVVCRSPCGVVVDGSLGGEFVFGGKEITPSGKFQFLGLKGDVTATVEPGSIGRRKAAAGTLLTFTTVLVTGLTLLAISAIGDDSESDVGKDIDQSMRNWGIGLSVVGGVGTIIGGALWSGSGTSYSLKPGKPQ